MNERAREYETVLLRVPHIDHAEVRETPDGMEVRVTSRSSRSPQQLLQEIVSLLRGYGWHDLRPDQVAIVQIQDGRFDESDTARLKIAGYAVAFVTHGYRAECRLVRGGRVVEAKAVSTTAMGAMAEATVQAVNQA